MAHRGSMAKCAVGAYPGGRLLHAAGSLASRRPLSVEGVESDVIASGIGRRHVSFLAAYPLAAPGVMAGLVLAFARVPRDFGATTECLGNIEGQRTLPRPAVSASRPHADAGVGPAGML